LPDRNRENAVDLAGGWRERGAVGNRYILNAKLVDVESSKLINSVSRNYTRIGDLLQDSGDVVLRLLRPGAEGGALATVVLDQSTPVTDSGPAAP
jgi:hypothetical protein